MLPQAAPIGGGGFMVIHEANTNQNFTIDYRETAPARATRDMFITDGIVNRRISAGILSKLRYAWNCLRFIFIAHQKFGKITMEKIN